MSVKAAGALQRVKKFKVDDRVTPDPASDRIPWQTRGRWFRVTKVNPKNIRADAEDGGRGINFPAELLLTEAEAEEYVSKHGDLNARPVRVMEIPDPFYTGEIVTLKNGFPKFGWTSTTPLVVWKDDGRRVNVSILGGDVEQRYVRVSHKNLVRRDLKWLGEELF